MNLSHEKIIFCPKKRERKVFLLVGFVILMGTALRIYSFLTDPSEACHAETTFFMLCAGVTLCAIIIGGHKKQQVQQFYITEDGVLIRNGFSGKWVKIAFNSMAAVAACRGVFGSSLVLVTRSQTTFVVGPYTPDSMYEAVCLLKNKHIPICNNAKAAKQTAADTAGETEDFELGDTPPHNTYLHYCVIVVPILTALCLFICGMLNQYCGTQKDLVMYGTVTDTSIDHHFIRSDEGRVLLRSGKNEEWFPVSVSFVTHVHGGDRIKVHYKKGGFGLGYDIACTKL